MHNGSPRFRMHAYTDALCTTLGFHAINKQHSPLAKFDGPTPKSLSKKEPCAGDLRVSSLLVSRFQVPSRANPICPTVWDMTSPKFQPKQGVTCV